MKTYVLFYLINLVVSLNAPGKIINAYEKDIYSARISLGHLSAMPGHKKVRKEIERLRQFILYHDITEQMISHFRLIAPDIHYEIDNIKDFKGRSVDVYLRFVPAAGSRAELATTNVGQVKTDEHAYYSNYGPHTVAVTIAVVKDSLLILAHEFGHIAYQVPNLARYVDFFSMHYYEQMEHLGHHPHDPSGLSAIRFEKRFKQQLSKVVQMKKYKQVTSAVLADLTLTQ